MERTDDAQLIRDILSGDDAAFNTLVEKYQKSVHALVWRKISDFHHAEEITQDTFLRAYEKLSTLRNPNLFAGWLYVIANRLCIGWIRKQKPAMRSLEGVSVKEIDRLSYERYVSEQREAQATERRYGIVEKLLERLPESERTVVTLHYLGEMTVKEIGKFLGVSANTIASRLYRAQKRLRGKEEIMIREILGSVQFPSNLTENIMRHIADMNPTSPPAPKPIMPWVALSAAAVFIILLLGASNLHLTRFQKPYNFDAASEPTIEIVDTAVVLNIDAEPDLRNQIGQAMSPNQGRGAGMQTSQTLPADTTQTDVRSKFSTSQWTQVRGPRSNHIRDLFAMSDSALYTYSSMGVYKLTPDATAWEQVNIDAPIGDFQMLMTEHSDTLYVVSGDKVSALTDSSKTLNTLGTRPSGIPVGFVAIEGAPERNRHAPVIMYLAFQNKGVFRSRDLGNQWRSVNSGLTDRQIHKLVAVGNTVFAGTNKGLFRLNADVWEQLPVDPSKTVHALAVSGNNLYVGTGRSVQMVMRVDDSRTGRIFRSSDVGASWTEITPKDESGHFMAPTGVSMSVTGETILVRGFGLFRSRDGGQTWKDLGENVNSVTFAALNENIFYKAGIYGIHRTTDGGESWHPFMDGMVGTGILELVAFNNRLYGHTLNGVVQSVDDGDSWTTVPIHFSQNSSESSTSKVLGDSFYPDMKLVISDNVLYGMVFVGDNLSIFHLSTDQNALVPVQKVPTFDRKKLPPEVLEMLTKRAIADPSTTRFSNDPEEDDKLGDMLHFLEDSVETGAFVVRDNTFYIEYNRRLLKRTPDNPKWEETGLIDTSNAVSKRSYVRLKNGFKLAVFAETVYVGKRNGKLFQSLDGGNSWRDITPILPLGFTRFNEIVFVGSTVYIATDTGVLTSETGEHWRMLTDGTGTHIVVDRLAVNGTTVYGAGDTGLYHLDTHRKWEQMLPSVPDTVISLIVRNDRLYIATQRRGIFYIPLENEYMDVSSHK